MHSVYPLLPSLKSLGKGIHFIQEEKLTKDKSWGHFAEETKPSQAQHGAEQGGVPRDQARSRPFASVPALSSSAPANPCFCRGTRRASPAHLYLEKLAFNFTSLLILLLLQASQGQVWSCF